MKYNYTEKEASDYAKEANKTVYIRTYVNGNSYDTPREATVDESALIERAIAAALYTIRTGRDESTAKATAEFFVLYESGEPHINTYDSVFIPINDFLREHTA